MAVRGELEYVLSQVVSARGEEFGGHSFAARMRGPAAEAVQAVVETITARSSSLPTADSYKVQGSPGLGGWAETVWVSIFDRLVTESAQRGYYPVYLFRHDGAAVHLSLNQATTAALNAVGRPNYLRHLEERANLDVGLLTREGLDGLDTGPLDLDGHSDNSKGYEAGNIASTTYLAGSVPDESALTEDLLRFLELYRALSTGRSTEEAEAGSGGSSSSKKEFIEEQRYTWHRKAERNHALALEAKRIHGLTCQVCEITLADVYGSVAATYIEAHHLTPYADLGGTPKALDPTDDFRVVCPNCHRMLHLGAPYTLAELRAMMGKSPVL